MAVFTNQARLSYTGGSILSNIATGEIREAVSISKAAVSQGYFPGERVSYAVSLVNTGSAALSALTLSDDLGTYTTSEGAILYPLRYTDGSLLYYLDGVLQPAPTVTAGPPLTVTGLEIPAGSSAMLIYEAVANEYAPLDDGAQITNTATLTGAGLTAPLTASATVPVQAAPQLSITKSVSPEVVAGNEELVYTFVIQNAGSEAGIDDAVVITDTFDPILRDLEVTLNGVTLPPTAYTYSEASGFFATVAGQLPIPGASFTQNTDGSWTMTPGVTVLTVSGTM